MLQVNLLPDVKLEFLRAKRMKHTVYVGSLIAVSVSAGILVVLFLLVTVQKRHISGLTKDIATTQKSLESTQDLAKILTIQSQLETLPALYDQRPVTSRLFPYIQQTTPSSVKLSSFRINFADNTITIQGTASSLDQVNLYVDTLKFTEYTVNGSSEQQPAFSNVTLTSFSRNAVDASFTITMNFDPAIFDSKNEVTLVVPKTVTTRSSTELPNDLFEAQPTEAQP